MGAYSCSIFTLMLLSAWHLLSYLLPMICFASKALIGAFWYTGIEFSSKAGVCHFLLKLAKDNPEAGNHIADQQDTTRRRQQEESVFTKSSLPLSFLIWVSLLYHYQSLTKVKGVRLLLNKKMHWCSTTHSKIFFVCTLFSGCTDKVHRKLSSYVYQVSM